MKENVLITACGAKVGLLRAFREALAARGLGRVIACDAAADAAAFLDADRALRVPRWDDPGYGEALVEVCRRHEVGLLVPTADGEMPWLAPIAERLRAEGTAVLLPSTRTIGICADKRAFAAFCAARGFAVPETLAAGEMPAHFPVFVRPERGRGGLGAGRVDSTEMLEALCALHADLLVQAFVDEPEYSIDLLMDIEGGRALQAVARRRIAVRGGEACVSRVEDIPPLADAAMRLGEALGLVGHNVVQAFYTPEGGPRFIEVNPRFGGASSLSIRAGLDSPARLLGLLHGDASARAPRPIRHGLTLLRHAEDRFLMPDEMVRLSAAFGEDA